MLVSCRISVSVARYDMVRYVTHTMSVACGLQIFYAPAEGTGDSVSDCVEMYQNGQDENAAFFWHQICCGSHRRDSQPPVITRDTKKTDKKAKFLSGCPRRKSPLFTLPVFMQFQ